MGVSFNGIGQMAVTFETAANVEDGYPVKMSANGKVESCSAGDRFCGIALFTAGDGYGTIQLKGYVKAEYTGTAPTIGYGHLTAAASGKVQTDSGTDDGYTGGEYLITDVNTTDKTVGFII